MNNNLNGSSMNFACTIEKIDSHKVISFDIFDTLLLRPYAKPEDMFAHIEKMTGRKGFAERRKRAESEFYKTNGYKTEAGILDIYGEMGEFSDLKDMELDMEFAVLSQNSEMKTIDKKLRDPYHYI